uniref:MYND-type domain-containing protein n=1 Tax=Panagrolaimus sp. JU765 TaxID=591449 RepID=A0AC34RGM9_9BILA
MSIIVSTVELPRLIQERVPRMKASVKDSKNPMLSFCSNCLSQAPVASCCNFAAYCSSECQLADWVMHHAICLHEEYVNSMRKTRSCNY